jgi:8-oxo-dGTP diphosphatase
LARAAEGGENLIHPSPSGRKEERPKDTLAIDVVAGIILDGRGRFLIARRKSGGTNGGLWEFPGGTVEVGENREEALARELLEELGIRVRVGERLRSCEHDHPARPIMLHFYFTEQLGGALRMRVHDDVRWISVEEAGGYEFAPADAKAVERLRDVLG